MPGPRRLSADVIRLRGNRSKLTKRQLAKREELHPRPIAPSPPADLSPLELECWRHHAPELEHHGLLTALDGVSYRHLCSAFALAVSCLEAMRPRKADGTPDRRRKGYEVVVPDRRGSLKKHPAFTQWRQATQTYLALCREFGLTPASRVGLRPTAAVVRSHEDDGDDDEFFGA